MSRDAQLYSLAETRQPPHPPAFGLAYTRSLLVSQDRRHIFVTLLNYQKENGIGVEDRSSLQFLNFMKIKYYIV
jgi:hypothetical protein